MIDTTELRRLALAAQEAALGDSWIGCPDVLAFEAVASPATVLALLDRLAAADAAAAHGWRRLADSTPADWQTVVVASLGEDTIVAQYHRGWWETTRAEDSRGVLAVDLWLPLPQLPWKP